MSAPYLRFMNGNSYPQESAFWDFVSDMQGRQYAELHRDRASRGRFGPQNWSPFAAHAGEHPWHHDFPYHPHPRGRHGHPGRRGPHGHAHDEQQGDQANVPADAQRGHEDADITPATDDTIRMEDNDNHDAPDPDISIPRNLQDGGEGSGDSSGTEDENNPGRPHRGGPHRGRHGGRGGREACGGRGGPRGGPHGPHGRHEHAEHAHRRGGPWAHAHGHGHGPGHPFGHGPGPMPWGGFGGRRGGHGPWGRRGPHPPQHPGALDFGELIRAFANDPRVHGLGDAVGNALRAAAAAVSPDGQETGTANAANNRNADANTGDDKNDNNPDVDFRPGADIYDAPGAYIVHLVLPGAKKEDISLNWDADRSELHVAGVIARDGDEETLQALALAERDIGVFERRVKLGVEKVDADGISARMDNGILIVSVPKKQEEETWTEVRKVDIL